VKKTKAVEKKQPPAASLLKLLVVDDDEAILKQIQWALSDAYEILTAGDKETALSTFGKEDV